jgi:hypothetical protein
MRTVHLVPLLAPLLASCMVHPSEQAPDAYEHPKPRPDGGSQPPDGTQPPGARRVFVTQGSYTGALTSYVTAADGLAAGDKICNLRAQAQNLGGTWVAWLSSSSKDAIDRVTSVGPWHRLDGPIAFANRAQLYGEPAVNLDIDEQGDRIYPGGGEVAVWTGTKAGGLHHADTCGDWTVAASTAMGRFGVDSTTFDWTDVLSRYCTTEQRLICFEQ